MRINVSKGLAIATAFAVLGGLIVVGGMPLHAADAPAQGKLTQKSLGQLLEGSLGLKPTTLETRYDFRFQAKHDEDWALSMSAVLSEDGSSIWIMAWLDELPRSSREVPRVALLRLLADNDKMGNGKFFAYIPGNRRFVLQRVIPNQGITAKKFRDLLSDLGKTVSDTHGHWNVAGWTQKPETTKQQATAEKAERRSSKTVPSGGTTRRRSATRTRRSTTRK